MAESAKDLMNQNLGGSGDKDNKDATTSGGTVPPTSDATADEMDADDELPEGGTTAVLPPATDSFGSLDDEAMLEEEKGKTLNLRGGSDEGKQGDTASGGSGDSGGNKPPAPPSGGDGGGNEGGGGGDNSARAQILAHISDAITKIEALAGGVSHSEALDLKLKEMTDFIMPLTMGPITDNDLEAIKAALLKMLGKIEGPCERLGVLTKRKTIDNADEVMRRVKQKQGM